MPYELVSNGDQMEATVGAADRDTLFRDAVAAGLEAIYAGVPAGEPVTGDLVPIQAAGSDLGKLLSTLLKNLVRAAGGASGALHPPRWLAFDNDRVTAALPSSGAAVPARDLEVTVLEARGGWPRGEGTARIRFSAPVAVPHR